MIVIFIILIGSYFLLRCALYEDERMKSESLRTTIKSRAASTDDRNVMKELCVDIVELCTETTN